MRTINTYTLKQYKECYPDLLERHKLEYEDHNEYTFINTELESFYDGFIEIEDIEELPFQFQFLKSFTDEELSDALLSQREFKDFAIKSNLSSSMIIGFLEQRKQELEKELRTVQQLIEGPKILKNEKPKTNKIPEKWHALHYWFELMAHGKLPPIDLDGAFKKNELVKVGMQKCNSKGQSFYSEFKEIDINNPVLLKKAFGVDWKDEILKLAENDDVTLKYINKKYK